MCGCTKRSPRGVGWLDGAWRDGIPWVCCERVATSMRVALMRTVTHRLSEVGDTNVQDFIQLFLTYDGCACCDEQVEMVDQIAECKRFNY